MFTTTVDKTTLPMINDLGRQASEAANKLDDLIWLVKAQAVKQLAEATRAYTDAYDKNSTTPELAEAVRVAAERVTTLDKFWNQEVAMMNRARHFANLAEGNGAGWQALDAVMKIVIETTGWASTSDPREGKKVELIHSI